MSDVNQFKKKPRRKVPRGKLISVSAEDKQAYADLIKARDEKELAVGRHLPADIKR